MFAIPRDALQEASQQIASDREALRDAVSTQLQLEHDVAPNFCMSWQQGHVMLEADMSNMG